MRDPDLSARSVEWAGLLSSADQMWLAYTWSAEKTEPAPQISAVSVGLVRFSLANPGVSVSGGYATDTNTL